MKKINLGAGGGETMIRKYCLNFQFKKCKKKIVPFPCICALSVGFLLASSFTGLVYDKIPQVDCFRLYLVNT